ncbi:MAG: DUF4175 family protein [bacterium]
MEENRKYLKEIENKLDSFLNRESLILCVKGFCITLVAALSAFLLFSILEMTLNFSTVVRTILFFVFLIITLAAFFYYFIPPFARIFNLLSRPGYYETAARIGNHFPFIKDELINSMQLVKTESAKIYSPELIDHAFKRAYEISKPVNFNNILVFSSIKKYIQATSGIVILFVLLFAFVPGLQAAGLRLVNFSKDYSPPPKFVFFIQPGNSVITKGMDVSIQVKVSGEVPDEIYLLTRSAEQSEFIEHLLKIDSLGVYNFQLFSVRSGFEYFASAAGLDSEVFKIDVINKPVINGFEVTITPPFYSGLPEVVQKDNGNFYALPGSKISINLSSTKELDSANIFFSDSTQIKMKVADNSAHTSFKVTTERDYSFLLTDSEGNENENPITYSIKTLPDVFPGIEVISPNKDVRITNEENLPAAVKVSDDYGFTKLTLNYRISASKFDIPQENFTSINIPFDVKSKEIEVYYVWNLNSLMLATEDVVSYYFEIFDNDNVSGPKSTKSALFSLRVPSLDEIFTEADRKQENAENDLQKTLKEANELKEELKKISNELKKDSREITWEEKDKIEKSIEKFEELQQKIEDIKSNLNETKNELQQNNLLSEKTLEKYTELQKLMEEIGNEDLKKAFEKMQEMLESLMRDKVQDAMENMQMDEEMFQKSLERTINLLKRIQIEQKMDELVKRTEELQKKQEELAKESQNSKQSDDQKSSELAKKQDQVSKDLQNMKEAMKDLQDKMKEFKDMPNQEMQKAMEEFEKQQNQQLSEQSQQQLKQQQFQKAAQKQNKLSQNMQKMGQMMMQMQQSMQMQNQMEVMMDMMRLLNNTLELSKEQEELKNSTDQMSPNSPQFSEKTKEQNELQQNLQNLMKQFSELSQKTFNITPEMGRALGNALNSMKQSQNSMQERNEGLAAAQQKDAMKSLNEAASLLQGAMSQMMNQSQNGGMPTMMQQLQQIGQQQMALNQMMGKINPNAMGQQEWQQLERLAQQQDLIRKSLEQLNKEARETGQSKKLTANLEQIAKEMKEVVTQMQSESYDDNLIQKQERILSKLLDAQRSMNERDFEERRESNSGQNVTRQSPPELILNTSEGKDLLKDELLKAAKEGYSKDYEELIRKYFEALQKESIKN